MTARKLTNEEIDCLFSFVEQHDVKYYDVQMELVDHFASAIEQRWEIEPVLSFEEALRKEYRQFDRYDFPQIIAEKEETLRKKYRKIEHRYIIDFFTLPKIVATSFVTFFIYQIFQLFENYFRFVSWIVLADILLVGFFSFLVYPKIFSIELKENKNFLLLEHLKSRRNYFMQVGRLPSSLLMFLFFLNKDFHFTFIENPAFKIFVAFLASMSVVYFIATGIYVPSRVKTDFTSEYSQFVKA